MQLCRLLHEEDLEAQRAGEQPQTVRTRLEIELNKLEKAWVLPDA